MQVEPKEIVTVDGAGALAGNPLPVIVEVLGARTVLGDAPGVNVTPDVAACALSGATTSSPKQTSVATEPSALRFAIARMRRRKPARPAARPVATMTKDPGSGVTPGGGGGGPVTFVATIAWKSTPGSNPVGSLIVDEKVDSTVTGEAIPLRARDVVLRSPVKVAETAGSVGEMKETSSVPSKERESKRLGVKYDDVKVSLGLVSKLTTSCRSEKVTVVVTGFVSGERPLSGPVAFRMSNSAPGALASKERYPRVSWATRAGANALPTSTRARRQISLRLISKAPQCSNGTTNSYNLEDPIGGGNTLPGSASASNTPTAELRIE
jgi:hypothetical protein